MTIETTHICDRCGHRQTGARKTYDVHAIIEQRGANGSGWSAGPAAFASLCVTCGEALAAWLKVPLPRAKVRDRRAASREE